MINEYFKSERLAYRPYRLEDVQVLVERAHEESRRRWFYFQEPDCLTSEFWTEVVQKNMEMWSRKINILNEEAGLGIVLKDTGDLIGYVGLGKVRCDHVEIGYRIFEQHQNNGYATEAVKAAVEWGFHELKELSAELKIIGKIEHENWPSRKVAEKAGFAFAYAEEYLSVYEIKKSGNES